MLALPLLIETSNLFQPVMVCELIARTSSFFFAFPSLLVPYLLHFWGTWDVWVLAYGGCFSWRVLVWFSLKVRVHRRAAHWEGWLVYDPILCGCVANFSEVLMHNFGNLNGPLSSPDWIAGAMYYPQHCSRLGWRGCFSSPAISAVLARIPMWKCGSVYGESASEWCDLQYLNWNKPLWETLTRLWPHSFLMCFVRFGQNLHYSYLFLGSCFSILIDVEQYT